MSNQSASDAETRQQRRETKLKKKRQRMAKHGRNLAQKYKDAILRRLKRRPDAASQPKDKG